MIGKKFSKKSVKKSVLKEKVLKKAYLKEKEFEKNKKKSFNYSVFVGLFATFLSWLYIRDIILCSGIGILFFIIFFITMVNAPIIKHKKFTKRIENELGFFLTNLITELKVGKDLINALKKCSESEEKISKEYKKVIELIDNGLSLKEALLLMNKKFDSISVKRTNSNLYNIYQHGNDVHGLKKFSEELMMRQRIESKEFGSKMVVYALVFIAVSAIVPAMFASFILIGSYFMEIQFTAIQILLIIGLLFPIIDLSVLLTINSKTPLFLRK